MKPIPPTLSPTERQDLLEVLRRRFEDHPERHPGVAWDTVAQRLASRPEALWALREMERSGGEPDVVAVDPPGDGIVFMDCSPETPKGRTSVCYDRAGLDSRKEHKPRTSALDLAAEMGVELLTEDDYRGLQALGEFDRKTSSWVATPDGIRSRGGALYMERRYDRIFVGHNGAQSYYAVRGFRGRLRV